MEKIKESLIKSITLTQEDMKISKIFINKEHFFIEILHYRSTGFISPKEAGFKEKNMKDMFNVYLTPFSDYEMIEKIMNSSITDNNGNIEFDEILINEMHDNYIKEKETKEYEIREQNIKNLNKIFNDYEPINIEVLYENGKKYDFKKLKFFKNDDGEFSTTL